MWLLDMSGDDPNVVPYAKYQPAAVDLLKFLAAQDIRVTNE